MLRFIEWLRFIRWLQICCFLEVRDELVGLFEGQKMKKMFSCLTRDFESLLELKLPFLETSLWLKSMSDIDLLDWNVETSLICNTTGHHRYIRVSHMPHFCRYFHQGGSSDGNRFSKVMIMWFASTPWRECLYIVNVVPRLIFFFQNLIVKLWGAQTATVFTTKPRNLDHCIYKKCTRYIRYLHDYIIFPRFCRCWIW